MNAVGFDQDRSRLEYPIQIMFLDALVFNRNISFLDTPSVWTKTGRFCGASLLDPNISSWDTNNARVMCHTFQNATLSNQNISLWNTSNIRNMPFMNCNARTFKQYLVAWNTVKVWTMDGMFLSSFVILSWIQLPQVRVLSLRPNYCLLEQMGLLDLGSDHCGSRKNNRNEERD